MGGDFGCSVAVEGALQAARDFGISSILVGEEQELRQHLTKLGGSRETRIGIVHAPEVITMDDSPSLAIRGKANSSIRVAFELVQKQEASSVVSPGNTGAVMAAGLYVSGAMPGIARPAIASLIPRRGHHPPTVLLDSGANIDCHAHQLIQFALMGSYYAKSALSIPQPRVALLSNGSEPSKGNDNTRSAAQVLAKLPGIRFIGYVEGRDISKDTADVVVCDGFVGNIVLKAMEGCVELVFESIRDYVESSNRGKFGLWLARPMLKSLFKEKLDPSAYGGAPLLGLNDIAIVCHGSAGGRAIRNGIRVAQKFAEEGIIAKIRAALSSLDANTQGSFDEVVWDRMGQRFEGKRAKGGLLRRSRQTDESAALNGAGDYAAAAEGEGEEQNDGETEQ